MRVYSHYLRLPLEGITPCGPQDVRLCDIISHHGHGHISCQMPNGIAGQSPVLCLVVCVPNAYSLLLPVVYYCILVVVITVTVCRGRVCYAWWGK